MKYLLDTHVFIWAISNPGQLSKKVQKIIEDRNNIVVVSAISFWEIALKFSVGKVLIDGINPDNLINTCDKIGFLHLSLHPEVCTTYHKLSITYHKDPFDRMLIWQAIKDNYCLISKDDAIHKYQSQGLSVIW